MQLVSRPGGANAHAAGEHRGAEVVGFGGVDEGEERGDPEDPGVIAAQVDGGELLGELGSELLKAAGQCRVVHRVLELVQRVESAGTRGE